MQYDLGVLYIKTIQVFTLGTVSCFSELDIHCLNANNPPKNIALWDCARGELRGFLSQNRCLLNPMGVDVSRTRVRQRNKHGGIWFRVQTSPGKTISHKCGKVFRCLAYSWLTIATWQTTGKCNEHKNLASSELIRVKLGSIHFLVGGWAWGIPMSMNVKPPSPSFIFVKKCDPPPGSSKI